MFIKAILAAMALAMAANVDPGKAVEKLLVNSTRPRCQPRAARSLQAADRIVTRLEKCRLEWAMEGVGGVLLLCQSENHRAVIVVSRFIHSLSLGVRLQDLLGGAEQEVRNTHLTHERAVGLMLE